MFAVYCLLSAVCCLLFADRCVFAVLNAFKTTKIIPTVTHQAKISEMFWLLSIRIGWGTDLESRTKY